jgi:hypothetical protein
MSLGSEIDDALMMLFGSLENGDPGLIRTADLRFRKPMLYPSELRGHIEKKGPDNRLALHLRLNTPSPQA